MFHILLHLVAATQCITMHSPHMHANSIPVPRLSCSNKHATLNSNDIFLLIALFVRLPAHHTWLTITLTFSHGVASRLILTSLSHNLYTPPWHINCFTLSHHLPQSQYMYTLPQCLHAYVHFHCIITFTLHRLTTSKFTFTLNV